MWIKDYRSVKTPVFEVTVYDSTGNRSVVLPHHILRLIERVEILETFEPGARSTITLTIVEGSREPGFIDSSFSTNGLYKLANTSGTGVDMDVAGSINNRTGSVMDLRFSGNHGITFTSASESATGKLSNTLLTTVEGKKKSRKHVKEPTSPVFLFQERNQIKITWGYAEDSTSLRSIRGRIAVVTTIFPDNDHPETTITCFDTGAFLNQTSPTKGTPLGKLTKKKVGSGFLVTVQDFPVPNLLQEVATKLGVAAIISENLPAPILDKDKQKMLIAGQSLDEFLQKLALDHNAYYKIIPNPSTGEDTLIFLSKQDFESTLVVRDLNTLTYKAPGSILRSVRINADFSDIAGATHSGIDEEQTTSDGAELHTLFSEDVKKNKSDNNVKREGIIDLNPTSNNPIPACVNFENNFCSGKTTGRVTNSPVEDPGYNEDRSLVDSERYSRAIMAEIETIGHTRLTPGVVHIGGIGLRYSGKYRLQTVTHTIDNSGYSCRATGLTYGIPTGGVKLPEAQKANDPGTVDHYLVTPKNDTIAANSNNPLRSVYNNFIYKT